MTQLVEVISVYPMNLMVNDNRVLKPIKQISPCYRKGLFVFQMLSVNL
jgi:hypothetical protein